MDRLRRRPDRHVPEIPDKSEDPQLVSQIPCGGQHKNAAAVHGWPRPNRELVTRCCFRCLRQSQPAIPVAAGPFKTIADEAQTTPLSIGDGCLSLPGNALSGVVLHARARSLRWRDRNNRNCMHNKKPPPRRGLSDSVDLNRFVCSEWNRLIPDQPMAGACRATGVDSAAARSRGKL